ncbi:P-loop containing nucleoside triphosphate hydrolase protein [Phakopsora pachyrhizi]|uniref:P-loop containing nucleoside triphosphate hydrolase protein n=1 Tax=Phakopsora pachyrhizi TaxID=170000 RepID=A0AAV0BGB6_PHAPC|nr:P-loop containing nucleoside triphosphate hydrolase protein [Phakopsora pachyrhizi]
MDVLMVSPISKASAIQRAGRAGRTSPGKCFRLYTKDDYQALMDQTEPEICRTELTTVILQLKALGINNVVKGFEFLDPPNSIMVERALEFLYALGAISESGHLTDELGLKMAEMPVDPMMAKILLISLNVQKRL